MGDAARGLELFRALPHVRGTMREHVLREVVLLGDQAPPWVYSRWIARQAFRWMMVREDEELHRALLVTLTAGYADVDEHRPLGKDPMDLVMEVLTADWMCAQLALFEYGGLAAFLRKQAGRRLRERADRIDEWAGARMGGYRLTALVDDRLLAADLANGEPLELLNVGAAWGRDCGTCVIGRVVPISVAPGLMFESRPVTVDQHTARLVAAEAEPTGWVGVIGAARDAGRLAASFSIGDPTSLLCDVPGGAPSGLVGEGDADPGSAVRRLALQRAGLTESAVAAVRLCDLLLDEVRGDEAMVAGFVPPFVAMLLEPELHDAVRAHCVDPSSEDAWLALAAAVHPPFRERCLDLATLAAGHRPAA